MKNVSSTRAFSLPELLITLGILMVVGLIAFKFQGDIFYLNGVLQDDVNAHEETRRVIKQFSTELRSASQGSDGSYPIALASSTSISFFTDADNNSIREKITYYVSSGSLKKSVVVPTGSPLSYSTTSLGTVTTVISTLGATTTPIFSYYSKSYDGTASSTALASPIDIPSVRLVKITLSIDRSAARAPAPVTMTTAVMIRNLKDNL
jgi:type II secretory pathway pseudopilin PulG